MSAVNFATMENFPLYVLNSTTSPYAPPAVLPGTMTTAIPALSADIRENRRKPTIPSRTHTIPAPYLLPPRP